MPSQFRRLHLLEKPDYQPIIRRLRAHLAQNEIACLLGVHGLRLKASNRQGISISAARLGWLVLRLIENPRAPLHMFDILTLGAYEMTAEERAMMADETPQGKTQQFKDFSENHADTIGDYQI